MRTITNKEQLIAALGLLKENPDELSRQKKMSNAASKVRQFTEDEEEETDKGKDKGDEPEKKPAPDKGDKEGGSEEKPAQKTAKKGLPGAGALKDSPIETPDEVTGEEIADRINKIRAGASMKDEKVMKRIENYVTSLNDTQAREMYTYLDALARMVLGGMDSSEVPVPKTTKSDIVVKKGSSHTDKHTPAVKAKTKTSTKHKSHSDNDLPIVTPVTVGEGVVRKLKEVDVPVRSGKLVPFGSKSHIADIQGMIDDLARVRTYQEVGSESRHTLGLAIKSLRSQLKLASRRSMDGNPRTQPVPPIVEKEK
jgi:hypothetical protein